MVLCVLRVLCGSIFRRVHQRERVRGSNLRPGLRENDGRLQSGQCNRAQQRLRLQCAGARASGQPVAGY